MSKPSFTNIDLWLFEYAEGNLSEDQVAQLELFILQHPELDVDRDMWEMAQVQQEPVVYNDQEALLKRKPVGIYWGVAAGVTTMLLLIFGSYAIFGTNESNDLKSYNVGTSASSNDQSKRISSVSATESELRQEIADLKTIVASLENRLQNERGAATNTNVSNEYIVDLGLSSHGVVNAGTNGEFTNESSGSRTTSLPIEVASSLTASARNATNDQNATNSDNNGINNAVLANAENPSGTQTRVVLHPMDLMKPSLIESISASTKPISRNVFSTGSSQSNTMSESSVAASGNQLRTINYENSYRYKFSKMIRQLRNMANNPIALKNYRDAYHQVPGMTVTDLNFGATGTMIAPRVQVMSRLQEYGNENELFSNQIGFDSYVFGARGGLGVQMTHNYYNDGGIQSSEAAFTYSPKFSVNRKLSIEPAFRFKMGNKILDSDRMDGASQVEYIAGNTIDYYQDGTTPVGRTLWYRDMGVGLNVNTEWFYASAQVDNIFRHKDNIYSNDLNETRRAGTYFVATIGTDWESNDSQWETERSKFGLSPYLVYRNFENVNELWAGANFRAYWLSIGASISSNLDPAASLGIISSDKRFSLLYNADYSRSYITNERSLSHQLTLRIVGKQSRIGRRN